jgi:hypothetical protein
MATIAKLRSTGRHVIVVGAGYGMHSSARPGKLLGEMFPAESSGDARLIAVATVSGEVCWCPSEEIEIVEIDGETPAELLANLPAAETSSDLGFLASSPDEVRRHPQYAAFVEADPDHQHLYEENLVEEFAQWQKSVVSRSD